MIATDVGGVSEAIDDTGIMVPPQDEISLANAASNSSATHRCAHNSRLAGASGCVRASWSSSPSNATPSCTTTSSTPHVRSTGYGNHERPNDRHIAGARTSTPSMCTNGSDVPRTTSTSPPMAVPVGHGVRGGRRPAGDRSRPRGRGHQSRSGDGALQPCRRLLHRPHAVGPHSSSTGRRRRRRLPRSGNRSDPRTRIALRPARRDVAGVTSRLRPHPCPLGSAVRHQLGLGHRAGDGLHRLSHAGRCQLQERADHDGPGHRVDDAGHVVPFDDRRADLRRRHRRRRCRNWPRDLHGRQRNPADAFRGERLLAVLLAPGGVASIIVLAVGRDVFSSSACGHHDRRIILAVLVRALRHATFVSPVAIRSLATMPSSHPATSLTASSAGLPSSIVVIQAGPTHRRTTSPHAPARPAAGNPRRDGVAAPHLPRAHRQADESLGELPGSSRAGLARVPTVLRHLRRRQPPHRVAVVVAVQIHGGIAIGAWPSSAYSATVLHRPDPGAARSRSTWSCARG